MEIATPVLENSFAFLPPDTEIHKFKMSLCDAVRLPYSENAFSETLEHLITGVGWHIGGGSYCKHRGQHWKYQASLHTPPTLLVAVLRQTNLGYFTPPHRLPTLIRILSETDKKVFLIAARWHSKPYDFLDVAIFYTGYRCTKARKQAQIWLDEYVKVD